MGAGILIALTGLYVAILTVAVWWQVRSWRRRRDARLRERYRDASVEAGTGARRVHDAGRRTERW